MAIIAFANVVSRYFIHYSLAFTEEIAINCFVLLMIIGSGLAFERGSQLGMVSLFKRMPCAAQRTVIVLGAFLSASMYVVVDILLIRTIHAEITVFQSKSPALGIPNWIYYAMVLPASVAVFMGILRGARQQIRELTSCKT